MHNAVFHILPRNSYAEAYRLKTLLALLFLFSLASLAFTAPAKAATYTTYTFYKTHDVQTVNTVTGYSLAESQGDSAVTLKHSVIIATPNASQWAIRLWAVGSTGSLKEITDAYTVMVQRGGSSESGSQSDTFKPDQLSLGTAGHTSIKAIVYARIGLGASWTAKATFTTSLLMQRKLMNETVTWTVYTTRTRVSTNTTTTLVFGTATYSGSLAGMMFEDPYPPEAMIDKLRNLDFFSFIMYPLAYALGSYSLAYGAIFFGVCGCFYVKYRSFMPVLILFVLFGGAGGVITLLIPEVALHISWIFLVLGLGGLFYKWVR